MKYTTRPNSYDGCNIQVAFYLRQGLQVAWRPWNNDKADSTISLVKFYDPYSSYPYLTGRGWAKNAEPVEIKYRVKNASVITKWFEDNHWYFNGSHYINSEPGKDFEAFSIDNLVYCGKIIEDTTLFRMEWLEAITDEYDPLKL